MYKIYRMRRCAWIVHGGERAYSSIVKQWSKINSLIDLKQNQHYGDNRFDLSSVNEWLFRHIDCPKELDLSIYLARKESKRILLGNKYFTVSSQLFNRFAVLHCARYNARNGGNQFITKIYFADKYRSIVYADK